MLHLQCCCVLVLPALHFQALALSTGSHSRDGCLGGQHQGGQHDVLSNNIRKCPIFLILSLISQFWGRRSAYFLCGFVFDILDRDPSKGSSCWFLKND